MKLLFLGKPIWGPSSHHPRIRRKRSDTWNCKNGVPQQGIFQARIQRDLINVAGRTLQADQSSVGQSIHHVLQISGSNKIRSDWHFPIIFPIILPIKWFTKHDQNKWSPKPNIWWPWLQPPRCFSFSFSSCSSWWNMADKRNSHRSVKLFHVCLEHWSFDARLMFDGASCLVLMSFWLLVWWSFWWFGRYGQGTFTWACSFLLDSSAKRFSLSGSHFLGGPGGTHDPKISGLVINGKTHGLGHPSFCSLQLGTGIGRDASGSPPPESSVASAVPHSSPSAGQPGEIKTQINHQKAKGKYIYIYTGKCWKKNDQPIF